MKEKIFQALKQAYSNLGLSDDIFQGHSEALEATGLVTEDNLATIVAAQKAFLSSLQSGIDKRVTDAVNKAMEKKKKAKADEGGDSKQPDIQKMIDDVIAARLNPLQEKLDSYEVKEAKAARANLIMSKAKELKISQGRIDEGFAISEDMDESAIDSYLSKVRQNEVAKGLEDKGSAFSLSTPESQGKEMAREWAESLPDAN